MIPHLSLIVGALPTGIGVFIVVLLLALWYRNRREAAEGQARMDRTLRVYCTGFEDRAA
jgi:hypothetical protein